ncbi:MAG: hypothetical protein GKR90_20020 [Pseudomonadales bacterium]|nr:hypothetical protein [Pseudomonadales bacterium]
MSVTVDRQAFSNKDEAIACIESLSLFRRDGALAAGDLEDVHWHKTSLRIFVLEGTFETKDVALDQLLLAGAGDVISIPSATLHAARCPIPAKYVVGFESEEAAKTFRPESPGDLPEATS